MKPRILTEAQIVDTFHAVASLIGRYDAEDCIAHAIDQLTPKGADDEMREAISAAVRRAWVARFDIPGAG